MGSQLRQVDMYATLTGLLGIIRKGKPAPISTQPQHKPRYSPPVWNGARQTFDQSERVNTPPPPSCGGAFALRTLQTLQDNTTSDSGQKPDKAHSYQRLMETWQGG